LLANRSENRQSLSVRGSWLLPEPTKLSTGTYKFATASLLGVKAFKHGYDRMLWNTKEKITLERHFYRNKPRCYVYYVGSTASLQSSSAVFQLD